MTTKSTHEAYGIPTPAANAEGLRTTRMAIYLARHIRLDDLPEFKAEVDLIRREAKPVIDKVLEMGDGDAAQGAVKALEAGVLPARDVDGYLRIYDPAAMPFPKDVMAVHEEGLKKRAEAEGIPYDRDLAVKSVYEISEPLDRLLPFPWAAE